METNLLGLEAWDWNYTKWDKVPSERNVDKKVRNK